MLLRYDGPDGITYDRVVTAVDGDGEPVAWAPFSLNRGDAIDGVAINPDERVFTPVKKATVVVAPDNAPREPEPEAAPAVTPPAPPTPDAALAADSPQE